MDVLASAHGFSTDVTDTQAADDDELRHDSDVGPDVLKQVEQLGDALHKNVLKEVETECGRLANDTKRAMADHLWCEILAQFSHLIANGTRLVDSIPDRIAEIIIKHRKDEGRKPLENIIIKSAVKNIWKQINKLFGVGVRVKINTTLFIVRVLAIFICKSPERHRAVVEYCVDPLKNELKEKTKEKLLEVLHDWLPNLKKKFEAEYY